MERLYLGITVASTYTLVAMALILVFSTIRRARLINGSGGSNSNDRGHHRIRF